MRISIQGQIYQVINFAHYFDNKNWHCNYPFSPDTSCGGLKADKNSTFLWKFDSAYSHFFLHDETYELLKKMLEIRIFITYEWVSASIGAWVNLQKHFELKRIRAFAAVTITIKRVLNCFHTMIIKRVNEGWL